MRVNTKHSTLLKIGISCTRTILKITTSCTVTITRIKICGWQNNSHFLPYEVNCMNRRYCLGPEHNGILPCYIIGYIKQYAIGYWDIWEMNQQNPVKTILWSTRNRLYQTWWFYAQEEESAETIIKTSQEYMINSPKIIDFKKTKHKNNW